MRPLKIKDRCVKKQIKKCKEVARLYDKIQIAFADILASDDSIAEIRCNVPLNEIEEGEFTSDFVCVRSDGDYLVRECVFRKKLSLPRTLKLLDASRTYWLRRGIEDWGIVVEQEEKGNENE